MMNFFHVFEVSLLQAPVYKENLLGEATLNMKLMDLTEAIIICEISFLFMSLVLVYVIDMFSVIYFDSFVDLSNRLDIAVLFVLF